jgi:hypothetical protein
VSGSGVAFADLFYALDAQMAMIVGSKNITCTWESISMALML